MPVDYARVDRVAQYVAGIYAEAEAALIAAISRRLAAGHDSPDTWERQKLAEVRAVGRAAQLIVDRLRLRGPRALRQAIADGLRAGNDAAITDLAEAHIGDIGPTARAAGERGSAQVQALADAAVGELRPVHAALLRSTDDAYRAAVAGATARRVAGVADTRTAAQAAWSQLAAQGMTGFTDSAGRRWRSFTYVEMATRTAVARAAIIGQTDTWQTAGITHAYVVDNPRECPLCVVWETKILTLGEPNTAPGVATLEQAQAAGLSHPNCRHQLRPWAPGVRITAARKPEGPAGYTAEQQQRAIERKLRAWRERYAAAFTPQAEQWAARRIQAWAARLEDHLDAHPRLRRLTYREKPGAGYTAPPDRADDRAVLTRRR